jgi:hypothetical protein
MRRNTGILGVFRRPGMRLSIFSRQVAQRGERDRPEYLTFTLIGDVLDTLLIQRYLPAGPQHLPSIGRPHVRLISECGEGLSDTYRALHRHSIRVATQVDEIVMSDDVPTSLGSSEMPLFFNFSENTGRRAVCDETFTLPR